MISEAEIKDIMMTILEEKEKNMCKMLDLTSHTTYVYLNGQNVAYTKIYKLLRKVVYGDE